MTNFAKRTNYAHLGTAAISAIAIALMPLPDSSSAFAAQGPLGPPIGGSVPRTVPKPRRPAPIPVDQPVQPPRIPTRPSGSLGQPVGSPINPIDQRGSMFGDGEDSHGMEMSLWPEDMEVVNGLLQWRVNIVRFSPLVSSNYRTPVRPDGFITGIGKVSATFVLNQDGTCTSVLSLAGGPKATIQIACTNGPGLMFRVLRPPRQTRWIVIHAVYREAEGMPTVSRGYLADMRTGDVWQVSDYTAEGFVVQECSGEAKVLWNSDSARRLGLRVSQCLNTALWPSDNDRLASLRPARPVQEAVVRQPEPQSQSPTPEENAAWMAGYRDAFRSGVVTMTTSAVARERNYPTSDGSRVLRTLPAGTTITGRWVLGRDQTTRWLKRTDTGGYVWESNLTEDATVGEYVWDDSKWLNTDIREWGWLLAEFLVEKGANSAKSAAVRRYFYSLIHNLPPNLIDNLNNGSFKQSLLNELRPKGFGATLASAAEGIIFDKVKTIVIGAAKRELAKRYSPEVAEALEYVMIVSADTALGFATGGGAPGAYAAFAKSVTLNTLVKTAEAAQAYLALHQSDKRLQEVWIRQGQSIIELTAVSEINRGLGKLELSNRQLSVALSIQQDTLTELSNERTYSNQWLVISKLIDSKRLEIRGDLSGSKAATAEAKALANEFNGYRWTDLIHPVNYLTLYDKAAQAFRIDGVPGGSW